MDRFTIRPLGNASEWDLDIQQSSVGRWVKYSDVEATERRLIEVEDMAAWYQAQHRQLVAEREAIKAQLNDSVPFDRLKDSNFVHVNILRGTIALTREQALHIGGAEQLHKDNEKLQARVRELEGALLEISKNQIPYGTYTPDAGEDVQIVHMRMSAWHLLHGIGYELNTKGTP